MGDTVDYAQSILERAAGRDFMFWEFGHVIWRPLAYALFQLLPFVPSYFGYGAGAIVLLLMISWVGGLVSVLSLYGILTRVCQNTLAAIIAVVSLLLTHAFLNYLHTGTPYIPGLSLLLLGTYLLVRASEDGNRRLGIAFLAGASLAGAVLFWFPFVLAVPAALITAPLLSGFNKNRLQSTILTAMVCGGICLVVYSTIAVHIHIHNVSGFQEWMHRTARSTGSSNRGVTKMVFGLARSFINMGNDGMLFKRFLLHDPFNPVSAIDLMRVSLWKLLALYLFLAIVFLSLIKSKDGRRVLILLAVAFIPVVAFAIYWQGGDPERYLPLYPSFFIAIAWVLSSPVKPRVLKYSIVTFLIVMSVTNVFMLARPRLNTQEQASAARITPLLNILKPRSWVFAANWQDDLINFNRSFPLNPINQNSDVVIAAILSPGEPEVAYWQSDRASRIQSTWADGGDVWISRRLLSSRPAATWNWVEGDDPRVSWKDLYVYCSGLELGPSVGGNDGFILVPPTDHNRNYLNQFHKPADAK